MSGRVKPYATYGISPGSEVDILGAIHLTVEDSSGSVSESSPIGKPYGITNTAYSYERYIRLKVTVAPQNLFSNFKFWSGTISSPDPGVVFKVGTTSSYTTPVITESTKAIHTLHSTYPSYSQSLSLTGSLTTVGNTTCYVVVQCHVNSSASTGTIDSSRTLMHYAFDES